MNRFLHGAVAASALFGLAPACMGDLTPAGPTLRSLTTRFTYKASVTEAPSGAKSIHIWIPLPSDSTYQAIRDIQIDGPGNPTIKRESKYGNRMVYAHVENPTLPISYIVSFVARRKEVAILAGDRGGALPVRIQPSRFLAADNRVPIGGRYGEIANEVAGGKATPIDKLRAIYEHVIANMQYDYKKESPKYAQGDVAFVCDYKKGNCSDLHSYIISLARSLKIPAFLEYGFPLTGVPVADPLPKSGTIAGYHCWTWFYDQAKGWVVLDASDGRRWLDFKHPEVKERLFGNLVLERSAVVFSRGRDITLNPPQKSGPLNDFIYPYAEADGAPLKAAYEVRYEVVTPPGA